MMYTPGISVSVYFIFLFSSLFLSAKIILFVQSTKQKYFFIFSITFFHLIICVFQGKELILQCDWIRKTYRDIIAEQ
ncbi:MAG: hypothetical protein IKQ03_03155 [Prevotella sp.]|nr:hypothetical protein [Prevotella sp.]